MDTCLIPAIESGKFPVRKYTLKIKYISESHRANRGFVGGVKARGLAFSAMAVQQDMTLHHKHINRWTVHCLP